jgi:hypothetical protein
MQRETKKTCVETADGRIFRITINAVRKITNVYPNNHTKNTYISCKQNADNGQVCLEVTLYTRIREVLGLNLG